MKYDVDKICFGVICYDLGYDGMYYSFPCAFEKVTVDNSIEYRDLSGKKQYKGWSSYSGRSGSVIEHIDLSDMMHRRSKKDISSKMIKLYLLKYILLSKRIESKVAGDSEISEKSK